MLKESEFPFLWLHGGHIDMEWLHPHIRFPHSDCHMDRFPDMSLQALCFPGKLKNMEYGTDPDSQNRNLFFLHFLPCMHCHQRNSRHTAIHKAQYRILPSHGCRYEVVLHTVLPAMLLECLPYDRVMNVSACTPQSPFNDVVQYCGMDGRVTYLLIKEYII